MQQRISWPGFHKQIILCAVLWSLATSSMPAFAQAPIFATTDQVELLTSFSEQQEDFLRSQLTQAERHLKEQQELYRTFLGEPAGDASTEPDSPQDWQDRAVDAGTDMLSRDPGMAAFLRSQVVDAAAAYQYAQRRLYEYQLLMQRGTLQTALNNPQTPFPQRAGIMKQLGVVNQLLEINALQAEQDAEIAYLDRFYVHDPAQRVDDITTPLVRSALAGAQIWFFGTKRLPADWRWLRQHRGWRVRHRYWLSEDKAWQQAQRTLAPAIVLLRQKQRILLTVEGFWEEIRANGAWSSTEIAATEGKQLLIKKLASEFGTDMPPNAIIDQVLRECQFDAKLQELNAALAKGTDAAAVADLRIAAVEGRTASELLRGKIEMELHGAARPPSVNFYEGHLARIGAEQSAIRNELSVAIDDTAKKALQERLKLLTREMEFINKIRGTSSWWRRGANNLGVIARRGMLSMDAALTLHGAVTLGSDLSLLYLWMFGIDKEVKGPDGQPLLNLDANKFAEYAMTYWNYQHDEAGVSRFWELDEPLRMPFIVMALSGIGDRQMKIVQRERDIAVKRSNMSAEMQTWPGIDAIPLLDPDIFLED